MSTTDLPGSSLLANRYRLVERLGAGGMSVVWRGFDEILGRQVAVKVLPPSTSADPSFRRRLRAEAQAAARLGHPNITNVYDYGEATTVDGEPVPYVVMELVDGESLAAVLARVRRLPWPAAVRICAEVSAALAAAHARGIVHRDVTPANVMLTPTGAKVVDFGISALIGENDIDPDGSLLGTPAYLAPERLEGGQVSPATDVYAVGLLIYRTLIGQLPWDVGTTTALLRAHQYTEPEPLPPVEGLPVEVSELIERCLEKRPEDRPSSAEMAQVLAGVPVGSPASRGYVPDWAESGEDTTILPSAYPDTDRIASVRRGQARVPDAVPAGRGVAAVRAAAEGPAGPVAAAAAHSAATENAPVSPAPGMAVPVSVSDVEAAVAGEPVSDVRPLAAAAAPGADFATGPGGASWGPGRDNRFGAPPRAATGGAAAVAAGAVGTPDAPPVPADAPSPVPASPSSSVPSSPALADAAVTALRPAVAGAASGPGTGAPPRQRAGDGGGGNPPPDAKKPGGAGGGRPGPPRSRRDQGRRVLVVAGAVALLGAGTYTWSLAAGPGRGGVVTPAQRAQPAPSVMPASSKCVVSYAVRSDDGSRFKASVTVANRDTVAIKNWSLFFVLRGSQVISGSGKLDLDQQGPTVTVTSAKTLSAQRAVTVDIAGRYTGTNAPPMVFKLGKETCETYVSPKPGEPSRPVQRLSNGQVRLGPQVKKPQPGLALDPRGVVVPVPVPSGSAPAVSTATVPPIGATTIGTPTASQSTYKGPVPKPGDAPQSTTPTSTTSEPAAEESTPPGESPPPTDDTDSGPYTDTGGTTPPAAGGS